MEQQGAAQGGSVGQQSPVRGAQHGKMGNRQQYGVGSNNGYGMGGAMPMPPEMMQGMQGPPGMMMPQFQTPPPYGILAYPTHAMIPMPMNPGMSPPMAMGGDHAHFQQQMMGGGRGSTNVFYKTRMCNKWRGGSCPFGDRCTYAHGQHELRRVPPEVLAQFEREQAKQQQNIMGAAAVQEPREAEGNEVQQDQDDQPQEKPKSQLYYKTRLCIRFMQSGYCARGSSCTFAHGYEDLRLLSSSAAAASTPQSRMDQGNGNNDEKEMEAEDGQKQGHDDLTPAQTRARAMCAIAGVGNAAKYASEEEVRKAKESLEDGSAFQNESPYGDVME